MLVVNMLNKILRFAKVRQAFKNYPYFLSVSWGIALFAKFAGNEVDFGVLRTLNDSHSHCHGLFVRKNQVVG